ncbi:MAG TPA: CRISPR-associated endoribonuclease Cas6 [Ktedonobacteraceae bacterium]|nr:CRISPR-associated endoribonuclease Cas6 [Ktedonobacteraceae bacterium]
MTVPTKESPDSQGNPLRSERGELFSMLLRLHPSEPALVAPSSGNQVQAAFLDMVHQGDPTLAEWLHAPNQRRPYTLGLLQGFNHLSAKQLEEAMVKNQAVQVTPGQVYWLRITMLDASVFGSFAHYLIANPRALTVRIGNARFEISRLLSIPDPDAASQSWVAYSSFAELRNSSVAQKQYHFEFATPTAFSMGQKQWGKLLKVFPEPKYVFESIARQWDLFAPASLRMASSGLTPRAIADWCEEHVIVARYSLETRYLPSSKFGQSGFQGDVTYEVKGIPTAPEAQWLAPLARFALFSGVGYKTTMGMGQTRCTNAMAGPLADQPAKEASV